MLRIIAHKIAQLFPERFQDEHTDLQGDAAHNAYEADQRARRNVYFIRETLMDPNSGQEIERFSDDGYTSPEEATSVAQSSLRDSIQEGAISVDIVHKTDGWVQSVWSQGEESQAAQPMVMPFAR